LIPLGYVIAAPVAGVIGISATFWIGATWVVVTTALVLLSRDIRELPRGPGTGKAPDDDAAKRASDLPFVLAGSAERQAASTEPDAEDRT
jgi:hypothetical protein